MPYQCICQHKGMPSDEWVMSWNGDTFPTTGPLWGELSGHRFVLSKRASNAVLWCLHCSLNYWITGHIAVKLAHFIATPLSSPPHATIGAISHLSLLIQPMPPVVSATVYHVTSTSHGTSVVPPPFILTSTSHAISGATPFILTSISRAISGAAPFILTSTSHTISGATPFIFTSTPRAVSGATPFYPYQYTPC